MIATLWLLTITLITASECVYAPPPLVKYRRLDNTPFGIQDDFIPEKRSKPSLSIVNPLDVLRQRLLLEIARRQMRENSKQVEINRAILKNVGKRGNNNERQTTLEHFEPFQQHPDLNSLIGTLADAASRVNYQLPDYFFDDDNNNIDTKPLRFHPFSRYNFIGDVADDEDDAWLNDKKQQQQQQQQLQQRLHQKHQQRLNGQNKHYLRQWDNKQLNEKTQVQQQQQQQQGTTQHADDEHFMLQSFDTN